MSKIVYIIFFICLCFACTYSQSISRITTRCKPPYQSLFGSVTANNLGDIVSVPCPTRTNIFSNTTTFSDGISIPVTQEKNYFFLGMSAPLTVTTPNINFGNVNLWVNPTSAVTFGGYGFQFRTTVGGASTGVSATGVSGFASNFGDTGGSVSLRGVIGFADMNFDTSAPVYGGFFQGFQGGTHTSSGGLYGVRGESLGGHNGFTLNEWGGYFIAKSAGGGGAATITNAFGLQSVIDFNAGSTPNTVTAAKGLALQDWSLGGVSTLATSYGIYADTSIDIGTVRYFIFSTSTSPSNIAGDVVITSNTKGVVLKSPNGTCFRLVVDNAGVVTTTSITCP